MATASFGKVPYDATKSPEENFKAMKNAAIGNINYDPSKSIEDNFKAIKASSIEQLPYDPSKSFEDNMRFAQIGNDRAREWLRGVTPEPLKGVEDNWLANHMMNTEEVPLNPSNPSTGNN